jgi:hypothetical protein
MHWGTMSPEVKGLGHEAEQFPYLMPKLRMRSKHKTVVENHL